MAFGQYSKSTHFTALGLALIASLSLFQACSKASFRGIVADDNKKGEDSTGSKNTVPEDDPHGKKDPNSPECLQNPAACAFPTDPNNPGNPGSPTDPNQPGSETLKATDAFTVQANGGKVDLVWVIDNSASMAQEAAQVRNNFSSFVQSVDDRTDLRVALVSRGDSASTSVSYKGANTSPDRVQIDVPVHSTNLLALAASASCVPESTQLQAGNNPTVERLKIPRHEHDDLNYARKMEKVCDTGLDNDGWVEFTDVVMNIRNRLSSFYRAEAKRVYVLVTDDDAVGVTDKNFLAAIQKSSGTKTPVVFAFSGRQSTGSSCEIINRGLAYENLASRTGGTTFDICVPDWSSSFSTLANSVVEISNNGFALSQAQIVKVLEVKLDGKVVESSSYDLKGSTLVFKPGVLSKEGQKIEVSYEYRK